MTLPRIGESLRETLLEKGRKTWKASLVCTRCQEPCFPRGRDLLTGLCWLCRFPRTGA